MIDGTVEELLRQIESYRQMYGDEVLKWPVYAEQCSDIDREHKRGPQKWNIQLQPEIIGDEIAWNNEFFQVLGGAGCDYKEKYISIHVNF